MSKINSIRSIEKDKSQESHSFQFRGIWLPRSVCGLICRGELTSAAEITLLIMIESLVSGKRKACWASNSYFATELGMTSRAVQRCIQHLIKLGLVIREQTESQRYLKTSWSDAGNGVTDEKLGHGGDDPVCHGGDDKLGHVEQEEVNKKKRKGKTPAKPSGNGEQLFPGVRQPRSSRKDDRAPQEYKELDHFFRKWFREWNEKTGFRLSQADGSPHWQQLVERDRIPIEEVRRVVFWYCVKFQFAQNKHNYSHMANHGWVRFPIVTGAEQFRAKWQWIHDRFMFWQNENAGVPDDPVSEYCLELLETGTHPWDNDTL